MFKRFNYLLLITFGIIVLGGQISCKTKEGCGLEEKYNNPDMEKSKRSNSSLFSKSKRKG